MIGEDLEITDGIFNLTLAPHSTRSYLNDVMEAFMHRMASLHIESLRGNPAPVNYRILPYDGGSDHAVFADTSVDVPAVMLGHWPDPFHHTSQDTPDKTDPTVSPGAETAGRASRLPRTAAPAARPIRFRFQFSMGFSFSAQRVRLGMSPAQGLNR